MRLKVGNMRLISNWRSWVLGPDTISFNQNSYEASAWLGFTSVGPGQSTGASCFVIYMMLKNMLFSEGTLVAHSRLGQSQSGSTILFHCKKKLPPFIHLMLFLSHHFTWHFLIVWRDAGCQWNWLLEGAPPSNNNIGHNTPVSPSDKWQSWLGVNFGGHHLTKLNWRNGSESPVTEKRVWNQPWAWPDM